MKDIKAKRKKIEKKILSIFSILDVTGDNNKKYANFFKSLTDKQFSEWAERFFGDEEQNFFLEVLPYHNEPTIDQIKKALKFINVPAEEQVTFRHLNGVKTKDKVPVGYLFIKRHQQILSKKNSLADDIKERAIKTGQVVGKSKAARVTDMDNYSLQVISADNILKELLGARADDMEAKSKMYEKINTEGFVMQQEIKSDPRKKVVLNTVNSLFLGAGIKTDLVNKTLVLPITADTVDRK